MLIAENVTALIVFALWVAGFALGYLLRSWADAALGEWEDYITCPPRIARRRVRDVDEVA